MAYITWDPPRAFWTVPIIDYPLVWYGLFFALGFLFAYLVMRQMVTRKLEGRKREATLYTDCLLWFSVVGVLVGARLAEVFFYDWSYYRENPIEIFKIWKGGLASHGGAIGVTLALLLFYLTYGRRHSTITPLQLLDMVVIPTALLAAFIRIGNFFNQEILGTPTDLPWAVLFLHPLGGEEVVPRHPAQLYEAVFYFFTFFALYLLYRLHSVRLRSGLTFGIALIWIFSFRFLIEQVKERQEAASLTSLHMGQLLSLPFIIAGIATLLYSLLRYKPKKI